MSSPRASVRAIAAVLALLAASCGAADAAPQVAATTTTSTTTTTAAPTTTSTTTSTTTTLPPTTTTIPDPYETLIATARDSTPYLVAYEEPDGLPLAMPFRSPNPHQFGGPLTLMVTEGQRGDDWLKVQLPIRPNGSEGWIPAADYVISATTVRAEVDLANTSVRVFDRDELIAESQAAIGNWRTPTPLGTFYVAAIRENPPAESYLGTWAVVLSGYSEVLETFSGGLPVIAIHGSNHPDRVLGRAISNGCVRVPNDVIEFLAEHLPLGAPVVVNG